MPAALAAILLAASACGGKVSGRGRTAEDAGAASHPSDTKAGAPGASTSEGAALCPPTDQGLAGAPSALGCYAHETGGWRRIPCRCELSADNPATRRGIARFSLTLAGATQPPSLTALPDVEVTFEDPESTWFDTWSAQAQKAGDFAVTRRAGSTTVRLGNLALSLEAVPLEGCEKRLAKASTSGTPGTLSVTAEISDGQGTSLSRASATCTALPHPTVGRAQTE